MIIHPPKFIKRLFPSFIWDFPQEKDSIFLTFDDGPCPDVTPWVLDQLDKYKAKATFFCIGKNVELYPGIYNEILKRGHRVGNHTYSHVRKGWSLDNDTYVRDVDMARQLISSNLFRPPYARIKRTQAYMLSFRFKIIMWTILSRDYSRSLSGRKCAMNVIPHLYPGCIVVFHDSLKSSKNLKYALPLVLQAAKNRNLKCKSISI